MAATPKPIRKVMKEANANRRHAKSEMHPGVKMAQKQAAVKVVEKLEKKVGHKLKARKGTKERY